MKDCFEHDNVSMTAWITKNGIEIVDFKAWNDMPETSEYTFIMPDGTRRPGYPVNLFTFIQIDGLAYTPSRYEENAVVLKCVGAWSEKGLVPNEEGKEIASLFYPNFPKITKRTRRICHTGKNVLATLIDFLKRGRKNKKV